MKARWILITPFIIAALIVGIGDSCKKAQASGPHTFTRSWTAPHDDMTDPTSGPVTAYVMKWSTKRSDLVNNWDNCQPSCSITPTGTPKAPGTAEVLTWTQTVPLGDSIYFGIKAVDDAGNWSALSNILVEFVPDDIPPEAIADLR
jgi:hypothetical protein